MFWAVPSIAVQNFAFLMSLSMIASYLRGLVFVAVAVVIVANAVVVKLYLKFHPAPADKNLYKQNKDEPAFLCAVEESKVNQRETFLAGVLTSWVSPCTVWVSSLKFKSFFMVVASGVRLVVLNLLSLLVKLDFHQAARLSLFF